MKKFKTKISCKYDALELQRLLKKIGINHNSKNKKNLSKNVKAIYYNGKTYNTLGEGTMFQHLTMKEYDCSELIRTLQSLVEKEIVSVKLSTILKAHQQLSYEQFRNYLKNKAK